MSLNPFEDFKMVISANNGGALKSLSSKDPYTDFKNELKTKRSVELSPQSPKFDVTSNTINDFGGDQAKQVGQAALGAMNTLPRVGGAVLEGIKDYVQNPDNGGVLPSKDFLARIGKNVLSSLNPMSQQKTAGEVTSEVMQEKGESPYTSELYGVGNDILSQLAGERAISSLIPKKPNTSTSIGSKNVSGLSPEITTIDDSLTEVKGKMPIASKLKDESGQLFPKKGKGETEGGIPSESFGKQKEPNIAPELQRVISEEDRSNLKSQLSKSGDKPEREFYKSVVESKPELAQGLENSKQRFYEVVSNKESLEKANTRIATDINEAHRYVTEAKDITPEHTATALRLLDEYSKNPTTLANAVEIVEKYAPKLTQAGQAIQAASMMNRLSPDGILLYTQRQFNRAMEARPNLKGKLKITEDLANNLRNQAEVIQGMEEGYNKSVATAKMFKTIADQIPSTTLQKIELSQTIAQLLNFKTYVRNFLGNAGMVGLENIKDIVGTPVDYFISKFFGTQRTKSFPSVITQLKGFGKGFAQGTREGFQGINTLGLETKASLPAGNVFKNPIGKFLERTLKAGLGGADRAFYQAAVDDSLRMQMKLSGFKIPTEAMLEQAHWAGLYRTFQDDNVLSKFMSNTKRVMNLNKEFGVGSLVLKYPKTPANIALRGLAYSPAGFGKTLLEAAKPLFGKGFNQAEFVNSFSRAAVGSTSLFGLGYALGKTGIIEPKESNDKARQLKKELGIGDQKLNASMLKRYVASGFDEGALKRQIGDKYFTIDWFQPSFFPISIGSAYGDPRTRNKVVSLANMGEGFNLLAEQPFLKGLKQVDTRDLGASMQRIITSIPESFVPTAFSQLRYLTDPLGRETNVDKTASGNIQEMVNRVLNKIPGASKKLAPRVDVFGQKQEVIQPKYRTAGNIFLNPSNNSEFLNDSTKKTLLDIYENTGEADVIPGKQERFMSYKEKGWAKSKQVELNQKQMTDIDRFVGAKYGDWIDRLNGNEKFANAPDATKIKVFTRILTGLRQVARKKLYDRDFREK